MPMNVPLLLACLTVLLTAGQAAGAESSILPIPWKHQDVGPVEVKGSASYQKGVYTIRGTLDTWGTNDGFHFAWRPFKGDGEIVARVLTVENTMNHAKAGVMFRESLEASTKHAEACVTPVDGTQFLTRSAAGGKTAAATTGRDKGKLPYWVKVVRQGEKFSGYESADGEKWDLIGSATISMPERVYVGLVTSSHQKDKLCTATLDKVSLKQAAQR